MVLWRPTGFAAWVVLRPGDVPPLPELLLRRIVLRVLNVTGPFRFAFEALAGTIRITGIEESILGAWGRSDGG